MKRKMYRQGDVLLIETTITEDELADAEQVNPEQGKTVLAYGEVTGHCHVMEADVAQLFKLATGKEVVIVGEPTELVHGTLHGGAGDHNPIAVEAGVYESRIAREYSPQEVRRVYD